MMYFQNVKDADEWFVELLNSDYGTDADREYLKKKRAEYLKYLEEASKYYGPEREWEYVSWMYIEFVSDIFKDVLDRPEEP